MCKIVSIDRRSKKGIYSAAFPGGPRFLVLNAPGHDLQCVQLDSTTERRAFTCEKLTSKSIGNGVWRGKACVDIELLDPLEPNESQVGAVILGNHGFYFKFLDEKGLNRFIYLEEHVAATAPAELPEPSDVRPELVFRWEIWDGNRTDDRQIFFQSHPRSTEFSLGVSNGMDGALISPD